MKTAPKFFIFAAILLLGTFAGSAQTGTYLYSGSEQTITLDPGTYNITAYGAQGGNSAGLGAEMEGKFHAEPGQLHNFRECVACCGRHGGWWWNLYQWQFKNGDSDGQQRLHVCQLDGERSRGKFVRQLQFHANHEPDIGGKFHA